MSFKHKYVSPLCKETHKVSENTTLSLFLLTHISKKKKKNGGANEQIQDLAPDVNGEMWHTWHVPTYHLRHTWHVPTYRRLSEYPLAALCLFIQQDVCRRHLEESCYI